MRRSSGVPASPVDPVGAFLADLRLLRARSGQPSFRRLSQVAEERIATSPADSRPEPLPLSTVSEVLAGKRLPRVPRWPFVESYVVACLRSDGIGDTTVATETARWRERWRKLVDETGETDEADGADEGEQDSGPAGHPRRRWLTAVTMAGVFLLGAGIGSAGTALAVEHPPAGPGAVNPSVPPGPAGCAASAEPTGPNLLPGGDWWTSAPGMARLDSRGRNFDATISPGTRRPGDIVMIMSEVSLVEGRTYALAFTVTTDRETRILARVQDSQAPAYVWSLNEEIKTSQSLCRYVYRFPAALTSSESEVTFQVGGQPDALRLAVSDVVLVELSA